MSALRGLAGKHEAFCYPLANKKLFAWHVQVRGILVTRFKGVNFPHQAMMVLLLQPLIKSPFPHLFKPFPSSQQQQPGLPHSQWYRLHQPPPPPTQLSQGGVHSLATPPWLSRKLIHSRWLAALCQSQPSWSRGSRPWSTWR